MKLFRARPDALILQLGRDEKLLFEDLLLRYPVVPEGYQKLRRSRPDHADEDHQQLLDEALREQRGEFQAKVQTWLNVKERFRPVKGGFNFTLLRADVNWLLQVLNDVRVGNWLQLGAPEEMPGLADVPGYNQEQVHRWLGMELSGKFQMELLLALQAGAPG